MGNESLGRTGAGMMRDIVTRLFLLERRLTTATSIPTGFGGPFFGDEAPAGYILADGSLYPIQGHEALFGMWGTKYGGDGITTFGSPNMAKRVPVGRDATSAGFDTIGEIGGSETVTLTTEQIPSHAHPQNVSANAGTGGTGVRIDYDVDATGASPYAQGINTGTAGGGGSHPNMPPYIVVNYIIRG